MHEEKWKLAQEMRIQGIFEEIAERGQVLIQLVVRLGVLLLVRLGEGQKHCLGELIGRGPGELGAEEAAVQVGEHGGSAAETDVRSHRRGFLGQAEPTNGSIAYIGQARNLFATSSRKRDTQLMKLS